MAPASAIRATLDDLCRTEGKAELIARKIVQFPPSGHLPNEVAANIYVSLRSHARATGVGMAKSHGVGFAIPELPSGRESFSPDAAYHLGRLPDNPMRFLEGPPAFAVEVRSENDHGDAAEAEMAAKRTDYFEAGTLVVWDVDPMAGTVTIYRSMTPHQSTVCRSGDTADAEPAVAGWRMAVADVFAV